MLSLERLNNFPHIWNGLSRIIRVCGTINLNTERIPNQPPNGQREHPCFVVFARIVKSDQYDMFSSYNVIEAYKCNPGPFYLHGLSLIPGWISNHLTSKAWNEITCRFPSFNGCTVEVWKWIRNFIPHFIMDVITYPCYNSSHCMLVKATSGCNEQQM